MSVTISADWLKGSGTWDYRLKLLSDTLQLFPVESDDHWVFGVHQL